MRYSTTTTDLYESTYYLQNGCDLISIECIKINGKVTCRLSFSGADITRLQLEYFQGKASINLFDFRRAFGQVNALVHSAKKKAKKQVQQQAAERKGGSV